MIGGISTAGTTLKESQTTHDCLVPIYFVPRAVKSHFSAQMDSRGRFHYILQLAGDYEADTSAVRNPIWCLLGTIYPISGV
jgi:hypothetical protein